MTPKDTTPRHVLREQDVDMAVIEYCRTCGLDMGESLRVLVSVWRHLSADVEQHRATT